MLSTSLIAWSLLQGTLTLLLVGSVYLIGLHRGMSEPEVRAIAFSSLVLTNVGLILVNRSFSSSLWDAVSRRNPALWAILGIALPLLLASVSWAPIERLFQFGALDFDDMAILIAAAAILLGILEILKTRWKLLFAT